MKRILAVLIFLVLMCGAETAAQSLGQLQYGDFVFSTGLPHNPKEPVTMSEERLKIALDCIRKTFGSIREYKEYYSECCEMHHFEVLLESGDELDFEEGRLWGFKLVSSRFTVAKEWFKGGLRVGQKPALPQNGDIIIKPRKDHPDWYDFWDNKERTDIISLYILDPDGRIAEIHVSFNEC